MAYFDPRENRLYARVVYDGAVGVGKTANLLALARLFAGPHDREVYSPDDVGGRTLLLDWLEINAGVVAGLPLLCQIVAVPGTEALRERRAAILRSADVVVRVCDSRASSLDRVREELSTLRATERVPLVVQANHQDHPEAVSGLEVARALGLEPSTVVDAIASTGVGAVDTFVAAVRVLSRELSDRLENPSRRVIVGRPPSRSSTIAEIAHILPDPRAAAELYLEAVAAEIPARTRDYAQKGPPALPAFPDDDVATGLVWPADTARPVLKRLADHGLASARPRPLDDATFMHTAHDFVLETRRDRRHTSTESAKAALVAEARACTQLEGLLVEGTILAAKEARDGALWIWTARPEIPSLLAGLDDAVTERRPHLESYGTALAIAVRAATQHGLALSLGPGSFGLQRGFVRYVGSIRAGEARVGAPDLRAAMADLDEEDASVVLAAFEREGNRARSREEDRAERQNREPSFATEAGTR